MLCPYRQTIFQQTATWLAQDQDNTLLIVLDEAHLYSGVTGAEIALLLRRLQARLGICRERVRYILTSASLDLGEHGASDILDFSATLVGTRSQSATSFAIIQGKRLDPPTPLSGMQSNPTEEVGALAQFDLQTFANRVVNPEAALSSLTSVASQLNWPILATAEDMPQYLGRQLLRLHASQALWRSTLETHLLPPSRRHSFRCWMKGANVPTIRFSIGGSGSHG